MLDKGVKGMLFFMYNDNVVPILICHDLDEGVFVMQVPFFPPVEALEDYTQARCLDIVKKTIFAPELRDTEEARNLNVDIVDFHVWKMGGLVAS